MSIKGTNNERKTIKGSIKGTDGTTFQSGLEEKIDNGLDANAKIIISSFDEHGNLKSVYNDGHGMTEEDMIAYSQLSSDKPPGTKDHIGEHGVGAKNAMFRFVGETGYEKTTSVLPSPLSSKHVKKGMKVRLIADPAMRGVVKKKAGKNAQIDFTNSGESRTS